MISLILGLTSLFFSFFNNFDLARIIFGHLYLFIFSGWNLSKVFLPRTNILERIITASLFSILLTYPSSIIVTIIEGQAGADIFSRHLSLSMSVLFVLSTMVTIILQKLFSSLRQIPKKTISSFSISPLFLVALVIYTLFVFVNLDRSDIYGDEYDLGYQAYNLVDGIKAGRKAYVISFSGHPPLAMSAKHFSLNLLEPRGFDFLSDWQFRFSEGLFGLLTLSCVYLIALQFFSSPTAGLTTLFLSTNNYLVWIGRIMHREMLLTMLMSLTVYYLIKNQRVKSDIYLTGIAFGASLLVKETALVLIPVILLKFYFERKYFRSIVIALALFTPVIVYNILAFVTTGYADVFFSNLFGVFRPGATPRGEASAVENLISLITYLNDIYSPLILIFMVLAFVWLIKDQSVKFKKSSSDGFSYLLVWAISTVAFFSLSAVRGYYFIFITIPLILILIKFIQVIPYPKLRFSLVILLLSYSSIYTFNSNINRDDFSLPHPGNLDGSLYINHPLGLHRSLEVVSWTYTWGYKHLVNYLENTLTADDCLSVDPSLNSLAQRRYLWTNDPIKDYYLKDFSPRFPSCEQINPLVRKSYYLSATAYSNPDLKPEPLPISLKNFKLYSRTNP